MKNDALIEFYEYLNRYKDLRKESDEQASVKELAKAHYLLEQYSKYISKEDVSFVNFNVQEMLHVFKVVIEKENAKIKQIVSYGKRFLMEELLQVFTLRLEVEFLLKVIKSYIPNYDCHVIDELDLDIRAICSNNKSACTTAKQKIKNNWIAVRSLIDKTL